MTDPVHEDQETAADAVLPPAARSLLIEILTDLYDPVDLSDSDEDQPS